MSTQIDLEEIETTRSEKLLALVLAVFLLIGGLWIYYKLDDIPAKPDYNSYPDEDVRPADLAALDRHDRLVRNVSRTSRAERRARTQLEVRREAYRTALDAGRPAGALELSYNEAQREYAAAQQRTRRANAARKAQAPQAQAAERRYDQVVEETNQRREEVRQDHDRNTFLLRLGYVLATTALALWLLSRVRRRRPRYLALALAAVGFAAVQALFMAGDYFYDYVEFTDAGLLTISLIGGAMTFAAFVALQRYLARRIPGRRVRKRECPFCAFPVADNERCEGCGRSVYAPCSTCSNRRRVGTAHCGVCGAV